VTIIRDGIKIGTYPGHQMSEKQLISLMSGREVQHDIKHKSLMNKKINKNGYLERVPILSVENLTRQHHYEKISFCLYPGEILGLTGLLGSGRTELALSLFGMNPPDSGTIRLEGKQVKLASNRIAIENGIAYVPEDRLALSLNLDQPISSNIVITTLKSLKGRLGLISKSARTRLVRQYMEALKIKLSDPELAVQTLSGGNQQRVVLAKWLVTKPQILILDSPTVGVDFHGKAGIYAIIRQLAENGFSVLMICDEIEEVLLNSDRILVMRDGKIRGEFLATQTSAEQLKEVVYA